MNDILIALLTAYPAIALLSYIFVRQRYIEAIKGEIERPISKIALESERPVLQPVEGKLAIRNNGSSSAYNIQFYRITDEKIVKFDEFQKIVLGSGLSIKFDLKTQRISAIVIFYQDLATDDVYYTAFDCEPKESRHYPLGVKQSFFTL